MAAIAVVVAGVWLWRRRGDDAGARPPPPDLSLVTAPVKPARPPPPGAPRVRVPTPQMPPTAVAAGQAAADAARAAGRPPGEAAFRAMIHAFIEYNLEFAKAQAAKEGITVDEVEELTYLGYLVMATQRLDDVADLTGRTYTEVEREEIAGLMRTHNDAFKDALRAAVARGAPEAERRQLIADTEAAYRADLFARTGLDEDQLDSLLGGDLAKPGAPIAGGIPAHIEPRPYVEDQPRPGPAPR
ncbi:MAG: hypothetical protein R3B06_01440 [Kofleriaceae bacterium]